MTDIESTASPQAGHPPETIHVCIASGESLPNLLPVLQHRPAQVWILRTGTMQEHARHLADALRSQQIDSKAIPFDDSSFASMSHAAEELALMLDGRPCVINVTGGTKLMTLAMTQVLAPMLDDGAFRPRVLYVDTEHQRLEWVSRPLESEPMRDVLRIEPLLLAQGFRSQSDPDAAYRERERHDRQELTRTLGDNAASLAGWFGTMNWLASEALGADEASGPFQPAQKFTQPPSGKAADAMRQAVTLGLVGWQGGCDFQFADRAAARYFRGGWLEEFAAAKVAGFGQKVLWRAGLTVEQVRTGVRNEFDLIAVCRNRVLVIECKTGALRDDRASDAIYKLAQVGRAVGGRLVKTVLMSARRLQDEPRARAAEYGVELLEADKLARLPGLLRDWASA